MCGAERRQRAGGTGYERQDMMWRREKWSLYIPLRWIVVLSVALALLLNLFFWRRPRSSGG